MAATNVGGSDAGRALRRAQRSFWILVAIAVLAVGWLTTALAAGPSPLTGLQVATSGLLLISATVLAARVLVAVERARRRAVVDQTTPQ